MNETELIFFVVFAFAVGYAIAYSVKNVGRLSRQWGLLICIFVFPPAAIVLLLLAAMIADNGNVLTSSAFGAGFLIRMFRRG